MDLAMIRRNLEVAERHVREGERHIARQREIVRRLELRSPESVTLRIARGFRMSSGPRGHTSRTETGSAGCLLRAVNAPRRPAAYEKKREPRTIQRSGAKVRFCAHGDGAARPRAGSPYDGATAGVEKTAGSFHK
jgi:hypothetical protein